MWKGGLILLVVLGVALFLEFRQMRALDLPGVWVAAPVLAILATLAIGSIQGLAEAWTRKETPQSGPSQWRDGELVRVGGRLSGRGELLEAPLSGRRVVFYQYWVTEVVQERGIVKQRAGLRGMDRTPWELETDYGRIRLKGIPRMRDFLPVNHESNAIRGRLARLLASADWRIAPGVWNFSTEEGEALFANENGELPSHMINRLAADLLEVTPGQQSEEYYLERLAKRRHWNCQERSVEAGEEVTVAGTYRAAENVIDLSYGIAGAQHEMVRGGAAQTASRNLVTTVVFVLVLAALAGAAHYVVYAGGGVLWRSVVEKWTALA